MTGETVTYKGIPSTSTSNIIAKTLELQQWIIDPSSRPYSTPLVEEQKLIARSAGASLTNGEVNKKQSLVEKQLELQRMVLGD
jgi:hypothetical protein